MTKIDKVELHEFQFKAVNLGLSADTNSIGGLSYEKGAETPIANMQLRFSQKMAAKEVTY